MCLRYQFCSHQRVCILHFLKKVKFVVPFLRHVDCLEPKLAFLFSCLSYLNLVVPFFCQIFLCSVLHIFTCLFYFPFTCFLLYPFLFCISYSTYVLTELSSAWLNLTLKIYKNLLAIFVVAQNKSHAVHTYT